MHGFFTKTLLLFCALAFALPAAADENRFAPALIYVTGALDTDHAFVKMARAGARKAKERLKINFDEYRLPEKESPTEFIRSIAKKGYSPIIAVGFQNAASVISLAEDFPDTKFTVIDGLVPPLYPNVQSVVFKDHEGAFLIGMIAAYASDIGKIGFVGGMDVPLIRNFEAGYSQGARFVTPSIQIASDMVGTTSDAWSRPDIAYDLAKEQYEAGYDVVFAAAGGSSIGVLRAAKDEDALAIGVDSNQNGSYPGYVLTSLVKRVDVAVYDTIKRANAGHWQPGIKSLGLKEAALDFAVDQHNRDLLSPEIIDKVLDARERIINGLITVKEYQQD